MAYKKGNNLAQRLDDLKANGGGFVTPTAPGHAGKFNPKQDCAAWAKRIVDLHNALISIVINCKEGKNRSPLIVACILIAIHWRDDISADAIMDYVCTLHPNAEFRKQLPYSRCPQVLCLGTHM